MRMITILAAAAALSSCAPQATERPDTVPAAPAQAAGDRVVGTVRVVGSAPMNVEVVVQPASGAAVQVAGPLREEIERLSGAEVALTGRLEAAPGTMSGRRLRVTGYDILSVNGEPVVTGVVEGTSGGWVQLRTAQGELLYLSGAPREFRAGQKVWVQGPRSMIVQSYGTIRP
jgi:hypothetical protein